jgi:hypothetical protein
MAQIIPLKPIFERLPAKTRTHGEVIVFVHHYGGHKYSFRRHMSWLNDLGYDVITFDLPLKEVFEIRPGKLPFDRLFKFGLRHVWAEKIETVLGSLSEKKILYSFSSPSASVLQVISARSAIDVNGWICDGGPFFDISGGIENYIREYNLHGLNRFQTLRKYYSKLISQIIQSKKYRADMISALHALPPNFSILSIRAEKDPLVSVDMIDDFFAHTPAGVRVEKLLLKNSGHLTGFRDEPEFYKTHAQQYLNEIASNISTKF